MTVLSLIKTVRWQDILDIVIIAYLIYRVMTFVRSTATANVIKGIILLVAVMGLSSALQLNVVSFLLGKAFELGILALIVLFQPELRSFLERFGSRSIFKRKANIADVEYAIENTVAACTDLAKTKTGALIVFERNINLESYIESGTIVEALPAAELLKNIFYPNTPLHDGAVIIRNGKIAGAACMLPLSSNSNLSKELGMRHRAGVGISERSDAVVVTVSEETGAISVAVEGTLKRHLSPTTFEKILRNELMPETEEKPKKWYIPRKKAGQ